VLVTITWLFAVLQRITIIHHSIHSQKYYLRPQFSEYCPTERHISRYETKRQKFTVWYDCIRNSSNSLLIAYMESDLYYRSNYFMSGANCCHVYGLIVYSCGFYCLLLLFYIAITTGLEPVAESTTSTITRLFTVIKLTSHSTRVKGQRPQRFSEQRRFKVTSTVNILSENNVK